MAAMVFPPFLLAFPELQLQKLMLAFLVANITHPRRATTTPPTPPFSTTTDNPTKLLASVSTFAFLAEAAGEVGAGFHYTTTPQSLKPIVLCKYAGRKCRKSRETIAIECTNFKLCRGRQICAHSAKDG